MPVLKNNETIIIDNQTKPANNAEINRSLSSLDNVIANPPSEIEVIKLKRAKEERQHEIDNVQKIISQTSLHSRTSNFSDNSKALDQEFTDEIKNLSPQLQKAFENLESYICYESNQQNN